LVLAISCQRSALSCQTVGISDQLSACWY